MYYTIQLLYSEDRYGLFSHIPFSSKVTTSEKEARELFDYYLKAYVNEWRGNKLISDKEVNLYRLGVMRNAIIECNEAAYIHGYYSLELCCFHHNPHE